MSWSFDGNGTPEEVEKLIETSTNNYLTEPSKGEWEEAKSHLLGLVKANMKTKVSLSANGHGSFTDGKKTYGQCNVTLKNLP